VSAGLERASGVLGSVPTFALLASRFLNLSGGTDADLCAVATSARAWAAGSPQAVNRAPLDADGYYASRMIATPLRVLDCARPVNGAVAVIVSSARPAAQMAANPAARPAITAACTPPRRCSAWRCSASSARAGCSWPTRAKSPSQATT
jgi:acetyl-CoA acetyltransferase